MLRSAFGWSSTLEDKLSKWYKELENAFPRTTFGTAFVKFVKGKAVLKKKLGPKHLSNASQTKPTSIVPYGVYFQNSYCILESSLV